MALGEKRELNVLCITMYKSVQINDGIIRSQTPSIKCLTFNSFHAAEETVEWVTGTPMSSSSSIGGVEY